MPRGFISNLVKVRKWRIAAPNICPGQRVKQGAKCQTLSISKMWVSTAAPSRREQA
jgi:hypothetical protein